MITIEDVLTWLEGVTEASDSTATIGWIQNKLSIDPTNIVPIINGIVTNKKTNALVSVFDRILTPGATTNDFALQALHDIQRTILEEIGKDSVDEETETNVIRFLVDFMPIILPLSPEENRKAEFVILLFRLYVRTTTDDNKSIINPLLPQLIQMAMAFMKREPLSILTDQLLKYFSLLAKNPKNTANVIALGLIPVVFELCKREGSTSHSAAYFSNLLYGFVIHLKQALPAERTTIEAAAMPLIHELTRYSCDKTPTVLELHENVVAFFGLLFQHIPSSPTLFGTAADLPPTAVTPFQLNVVLSLLSQPLMELTNTLKRTLLTTKPQLNLYALIILQKLLCTKMMQIDRPPSDDELTSLTTFSSCSEVLLDLIIREHDMTTIIIPDHEITTIRALVTLAKQAGPQAAIALELLETISRRAFESQSLPVICYLAEYCCDQTPEVRALQEHLLAVFGLCLQQHPSSIPAFAERDPASNAMTFFQLCVAQYLLAHSSTGLIDTLGRALSDVNQQVNEYGLAIAHKLLNETSLVIIGEGIPEIPTILTSFSNSASAFLDIISSDRGVTIITALLELCKRVGPQQAIALESLETIARYAPGNPALIERWGGISVLEEIVTESPIKDELVKYLREKTAGSDDDDNATKRMRA